MAFEFPIRIAVVRVEGRRRRYAAPSKDGDDSFDLCRGVSSAGLFGGPRYRGVVPTQCLRCVGGRGGDVVAHLTQGAQTWSAAITRARAGDTNPPAGEQMPRPGERASEVIAQRAIAFRQGIGEAALLHAFSEGCQRLHRVLL